MYLPVVQMLCLSGERKQRILVCRSLLLTLHPPLFLLAMLRLSLQLTMYLHQGMQ